MKIKFMDTAAMNESFLWTDPERLGGTPCFRGTRVPVQTLFDYVAAGDTMAEFLEDFPTVKREQAVAAIQSAGRELLAHS